MKFFRLSLPLLLILLIVSACTSPPGEEEGTDTEIDVIGLYPAGNDQYSILAHKTVRDNDQWMYYDSLMFIGVDTSGNEISSNSIPFEDRPYIRNQYLLDDGNIMLFGNLNSESYSWYFSTAVYSPLGTSVWDINMADRTHGVIPTQSGGLIALGWDETEENYDIITYAKVSASGDTLWSKAIVTYSYNVSLRSGIPTSDGGYLAIGEMYVPDKSTEILVAKINAVGDTLWTGTYGGDMYDGVDFVRELNDGSYLIVGELNLYDSTNANWGLNSGEQIYLIKLSADGDKLWTKAYGNTLRETANAVIETADGSIVICGKRSQSYVYLFDETEGWVGKLSADGDELWLNEFGGQLPIGVREISNGDLLVVTANLDGEYEWQNTDDLNMMKFTSSGDLIWNKTLNP